MHRRDLLKSALVAVVAATLPGSLRGCDSVSTILKATSSPTVASLEPGRLKVWAWLRMFATSGTFGIPTSEAAYKANLSRIDVAMPTNGGVLQGDGTWFQEPWKIMPAWPQSLPSLAREAGHLYMPTMYNDREGIYAVLDDPALQVTAAENLIALATTERFDAPWDGVYLDLEGISFNYRTQLSDFLYVLSERIRQAGLLVGVSVGGRTVDDVGDGYDYTVVREVADYVDVRCYGYRGPAPISIGPYWWVEACIQFALQQGIDPKKLTAGIANFSKYWPHSSENTTIEITHDAAMQLVTNAGASVEWIESNQHGLVRESFATVGEGHVWIHDARALQYRLELIDQYELLGVAIFAVGMGDESHWQVIEDWLRPHKVYTPIIQSETSASVEPYP